MANPDGLPVQDYMYGSEVVDDRYTGMWGIHRLFDAQVPHLQPLPDRSAPSGSISAQQMADMGHSAPFVGINRLTTLGQRARLLYEQGDDRSLTPDTADRKNANVGQKPPKPPNPGDPCPDDIPVRSYDVTAFQTDIEFNDYGDHDPHGISYALDSQVDGIKNGTRPPTPMTIRANQGDCIEINLTNELPSQLDDSHVDPPMRVERYSWSPSSRVSLHPQRITYDVNASDGSVVGFNYDGTIAPGETITYRWYADDLYDNMVLNDEADVRGHRHHGAFGNLVIEPPSATWLDPKTAEPLPDGVGAMITDADGTDKREYSISMTHGRYIINRNNPDSPVVPAVGGTVNPNSAPNYIGGFEDGGYGAVNNLSEPFSRRFQNDPAQHKVYDSGTHGDPSTNVFKAITDDPVKFMVHQSADKARGIAFHLSGHPWNQYRGVPESPVIGVDDRFSPHKGAKLGITSNAGGELQNPGDYLFQETKQRRRLESGMWGIFRVRNGPGQFNELVQPLPARANSSGTSPSQHQGWNVTRGDATGDGTEDVVIGVPDSSVGAPDGGAVYVFEDPGNASITSLADANASFVGTTAGERAGGAVAIRGNGSNPKIKAATGGQKTYDIPAGQPLKDEIGKPTGTPVRGFVKNTTKNSISAVRTLPDVANGYGAGGTSTSGGQDGPSTNSTNTTNNGRGGGSAKRGRFGKMSNLFRCESCGQESAAVGDASAWENITGKTKEVFECQSCGNHQHLEG
jgi:hypothetical protein